MKEGKGSVSFWIQWRMKLDSLTAGRIDQVLGRLTSIETSCAYLCQRSASNQYPGRQEKLRDRGKDCLPKQWTYGESEGCSMDCTMVAAGPVLPVGYVVTASRIADRRMILVGYRLADLLTRILKP